MISTTEHKTILNVPAQVVPNLEFIDQLLLNELVRQGRARIVEGNGTEDQP